MASGWNTSNMFECECYGAPNDDSFQNFWETSGECCDKLRFTIWLLFNIVFVILLVLIIFQVRRENKRKEGELYNFNIRKREDEKDRVDSDYSSVESIRDPFIG